jgi:hypothetical protein
MADWVFDRHGRPQFICERDCLLDSRGHVCAWLAGDNVYSTHGRHVGWFEQGVIYDSQNRALGFLEGATGPTPARPGLFGRPGTPGFAGRPGRPGLAGAPGRPGFGGWSAHDLQSYFRG